MMAEISRNEHDIAFLHTASTHVDVFEGLLGELAPALRQRHVVDASLLDDACKEVQISSNLFDRIHAAMHTAANTGARVVVCTCSTIGGVAESAGQGHHYQSMRVDRPMAEKAVRCGPNVLVVAALASTLAPTCELLRDAARHAQAEIETTEKLCPGAWELFLAGDTDAYHRRVADTLVDSARDADVIVLAQASMAGALAYCKSLGIPVLSSPRLGVQGALQRYLSLTRNNG